MVMTCGEQELSDERGRSRGLEESLAKANSAHKESLSALSREHERLNDELARTKTASVRWLLQSA